MRLLEINVVCGIKSTGRIATEIAKEYENKGYEVKIAYGRENVPDEYKKYAVRIGSRASVYHHAIISRLFDKSGFSSKRVTKAFLKWADEYNPDVLWLHNIHGYYINVEMLFEWIKSRPNMEVKWTLHDCWAFTGHCSHFTYVKCDKWKSACKNCPQICQYPRSIIDRSEKNYARKKQAFCGVKNMTIVVPSNWLKRLVNESFLSGYAVEVQYNKVNKDAFRPTANDFKEKLGIKDMKMVLGVASAWNERKGLYDLITLSQMLDEKKIKTVIVGLSERQIKKVNRIASDVIAMGKTNNAVELAKIYSAADVFVNPSYEETFGLTTAEAALCGTKAIVYAGSAAEEIAKKYGGLVVEANVNELYKATIDVLAL